MNDDIRNLNPEPDKTVATLADIQRIELKLNQITDRLDLLLMEGGREAGAKAQTMLKSILSQTKNHPAMTEGASTMLNDLLKPVIDGFGTGKKP